MRTLLGLYFALVIVTGVALKCFATPAGNELTLDRAAFAAVNVVTLGGFPTSIGLDGYTAIGVVIVLVATTLATWLALTIGGVGVAAVLGLPHRPARIAGAAGIAIVAAATVGSFALPLLHATAGPIASLLLAISALGNSGLCVGPPPPASSLAVGGLLLPLATLGGLGVCVWLELIGWFRFDRPPTLFARQACRWTAGVYLASVAMLWLIWPAGDAGRAKLVHVSAAVLNARTLGLPITIGAQPGDAVRWVLLGVMVIGAGAGGTGGGIKVTTIAAIVGRCRHNPWAAAMWLIAYCLIVAACGLGLLLTVPQMTLDRALWLAVSGTSCVGWTNGEPVSFVGGGLYVLAAAMLAGRFVPLWILWRQTDRATPGEAESLVG